MANIVVFSHIYIYRHIQYYIILYYVILYYVILYYIILYIILNYIICTVCGLCFFKPSNSFSDISSVHCVVIMVTDRIMEKKKTFNLDRRRLRPIFP